MRPMDHEREELENESAAQDGESGTDKDTPPAAPGDSDTPVGDTDQHSDADSPPAQTG